jgi:integrase/recombinase XerD
MAPNILLQSLAQQPSPAEQFSTDLASGLRASELARLKLQDIDLEAGAAKVWNGKGGKDGITPLSPPAVAALKQYLESVRPEYAKRGDSPALFLGRWGRPLTRQQVYYRVRDIAKAALGKHVAPHMVRHGFATALVEGGADIRDVQSLNASCTRRHYCRLHSR